MNYKRIFSILAATLLILNFQHCSVGGDSVSNLGSQSTSGSTTGVEPPPEAPTIDSDSTSMNLVPTVTAINFQGACDTQGSSTYTFEIDYTPSGGTKTTRRITGVCTTNRYSFAVAKADLGMSAPTAGVLSIRIVSFTSTGELPGNTVNINVTWKSLTAHPTQSCNVAPEYFMGSEVSISGTCTPPVGTVEVRMDYVIDDYGYIRINGATVVDYPFECKIQTGNIAVTMTIGAANTVLFQAYNCGLHGTGGRATFTYMGYW